MGIYDTSIKAVKAILFSLDEQYPELAVLAKKNE